MVKPEDISFEELIRREELWENRSDSEDSAVDLVQLLKSRDEELRLVSAERNLFKSQLRDSRAVVYEKDNEIRHFRIAKNKLVEENERLKAIIKEKEAEISKYSYIPEDEMPVPCDLSPDQIAEICRKLRRPNDGLMETLVYINPEYKKLLG